MQFNVAPLVNVNEVDLTTIVPQVSVSEAALGGVFRWGPIGVRTLIDSEDYFTQVYGKPNNLNGETFFTGASFLAYGDKLFVSRAANTVGVSPIVNMTTATGNTTVLANTTGLAVGQIVVATNASNIKLGATIGSIINATAFTIDTVSNITANGVVAAQVISNDAVYTAIANVGSVANLAYCVIKNPEDFAGKDGTFDTDVRFAAKYPGALGNSLKVSTCDTANGFTSTINLASYANGGATIAIPVGSNTATVTLLYVHDGSSNSTAQTAVTTAATNLKNAFQVTDLLAFGNTEIGTQSLKVVSSSNSTVTGNGSLYTAAFTITFDDQLRLIANQSVSSTITRYWEYFDLVDTAPGQSPYILAKGNTAAQDELHVVVADDGGLFTGVPGTVLEVYRGVSRASDAKTIDGGANFVKKVINDDSNYVYYITDRSTAPVANAISVSTASNTQIEAIRFNYGSDGADEATIAMTNLITAYQLFADPETFDVSLILQGKARGGTQNGQLANWIIDNICETRKDCVAIVSPDKADVVNNPGHEVDSILEYRNSLRSTSYAFCDSGYKQAYDKYNDVYRWVPLNGDIAGLIVRTDRTNDAWWSPAGYNRGIIKNVIKLAFNPRKAQRDLLYKSNVNSVITQLNQGTLLFGDKTLLTKPSAFDRINVRRLFIVIEKAIATASKYILFEINDDFTRANFRNLVVPYLRDVQGRRGITDFLVVCDETNNTPEVIDSNQLVGSIFIKPSRSINYINLNFVAVRTGVSFSEVTSAF